MAKNRQAGKNRQADAQARERADEVISLRVRGWTFENIGIRLGITRQAASLISSRELDRRRTEPSETTELLREQEAARLDWLIRVSAAKVEKAEMADDDEDGRPADISRDLDRLIKLSERRSKLLGLDAPVRVISEVVGNINEDTSLADAILGPPEE